MKKTTWYAAIAVAALAAGIAGAAEDGKSTAGAGLRQEGRALSAELQTKLDAVTASRESLLSQLKTLLEANATATEEERKALVDQWRVDNADALETVRASMQAVRQEIREWWQENRPAQSKVAAGLADPAVLGEAEGQAFMLQVKDQREAREQARLALKEQIANATTEAQRKEIVANQRESRLAEVQQARDETRTRKDQTDRDASVAMLRDRLRENADTLRTQLRTQDREEDVLRLQTRDLDQLTIRDSLRVQDRDRVSQ